MKKSNLLKIVAIRMMKRYMTSMSIPMRPVTKKTRKTNKAKTPIIVENRKKSASMPSLKQTNKMNRVSCLGSKRKTYPNQTRPNSIPPCVSNVLFNKTTTTIKLTNKITLKGSFLSPVSN